MATHIFPTPTFAERNRESRIHTDLLAALERTLHQHVNTAPMIPTKYHARVEIELEPPSMGEIIITWDCHYCRQIYKMAQALNEQHNVHA